MKYKVIGWNDEVMKFRGPCQRFREEHHFVTDTIPSQASLRAFATELGYLPRSGRGISQEICEPVYFLLEEG